MMTTKLSILRILSTVAALLLTTQCSHAADKWVEVHSPHFTISSNAGDHEARRIASQFEDIREVFHTTFPTLRLDSGKPMIVIAVKNQDALKVLLPDFYMNKDQAKMAGMFMPGFDRNFAILRTDVGSSTENPYKVLFHEYTHSIIRLNFSSLPTWFNEGIADFYGNTTLEGFQTGIGKANINQLKVLEHFSFIPTEILLGVDQRSPYYHDREKVTVFYAESWVLVHYLILSPDARKEQLFSRYLKALDATNDSVEAGRQTFGDLKKFDARIEAYARNRNFYYQPLKDLTKFSDKDFTAREMSPAEVLSVEADYLEHSGHSKDALPMLKKALELQPDLASAHAGLGLYYYQQHDNEEAEKEYTRTAQLDPSDFRPPFYLAEIEYRKNGYGEKSIPVITANLEKCLHNNTNFAPGFALLSAVYLRNKETAPKAVGAAVQAVRLEPMRFGYRVDLGEALLAVRRDAEAKDLGEKLTKSAKDPSEKALAENFSRRLARHEEAVKRNPDATFIPGPAKDLDTGIEIQETSGVETASPTSPNEVAPATSPDGTTVEEGVIREVECTENSLKVKFAILGDTLALSADDLAKINIRAAGKTSNLVDQPCDKWKGRKARVTYKTAASGKSSGEILTVDFF